MPSPADGVVVLVVRIEFIVLIVFRQSVGAGGGLSSNAIEHVAIFANLGHIPSAEGIFGNGVNIAVPVHIQHAGLVEDVLDIREDYGVLQFAVAGFSEDMTVIVIVQNAGGQGEFIGDIQSVVVQGFVADGNARGGDG